MGASADKETRQSSTSLLECDDPPAVLEVPGAQRMCDRTDDVVVQNGCAVDKAAAESDALKTSGCATNGDVFVDHCAVVSDNGHFTEVNSDGVSEGRCSANSRSISDVASDASEQSERIREDYVDARRHCQACQLRMDDGSDCESGCSRSWTLSRMDQGCHGEPDFSRGRTFSEVPWSLDDARRHSDCSQCSEAAADWQDVSEVARLRQQLAEAEARAAKAEERLRMWETLASQAAYIVALGPDRGDSYKRTFMKELTDAIKSVSLVHEVRDLVCSIPAVPSEAPCLSLTKWSGDLSQPMEWDVRWASTCWHVGVTVIGRQYGVSFSLKLQVHHFGVRGRIKVVLPEGGALDLSQAHVTFAEMPEVDFSVDCEVALGVVPLPVQRQVDAKIRAACTQWLSKELVEPNGMLFKIPSMKPKDELSDQDIQQAILDAEMIRRQSSSSWSLI